MVKFALTKKVQLMKRILLLLLLAPALCFSQNKPPDFWIGAGYAFYPGSSADVHLGSDAKNPFKSGFTAELTVEKQLNSFLYAGLGSSLLTFKDLHNTYVPVFADIRVIGTGKYKLYSFLNPGYGIYHNNYYYPLLNRSVIVTERGGFYIAYGFGVIYKIFYLQGKFNWLRFSSKSEVTGHSSKAYGVAGITLGVRLP